MVVFALSILDLKNILLYWFILDYVFPNVKYELLDDINYVNDIEVLNCYYTNYCKILYIVSL